MALAAEASTGTLRVTLLRGGHPLAAARVVLADTESGSEWAMTTDASGVTIFRALRPGRYTLRAEGARWDLDVSASEPMSLELDVAQALRATSEPFGTSRLHRETLRRLPHAPTAGAVLETLVPIVVTDRIDVAGVEGSTQALWGARGDSWTQNRVRLDGADVTAPAGGRPLLYLATPYFEELTLRTNGNGSPGAELRIVSRSLPSVSNGSVFFRYTGERLQGENLGADLIALAVEPREMESFFSGGLELGTESFHGSFHGFDLSTRIPRFDGEDRSRLLGVTAKFREKQYSLFGALQRLDRPSFGARPDAAVEATWDQTDTFGVLLARFRGEREGVTFSLARTSGTSSFSESASPLYDLATNELSDAPLLVNDGRRSRLGILATGDRRVGEHHLRAGVEWSHAMEETVETVPRNHQRLLVEGVPHAVALFSGSGERRVSVHRFDAHLRDEFSLSWLGQRFRLSPGARLDWSRSEEVQWVSLAGSVALGWAVSPSTEIQFTAARYPHALTSRIMAAAKGGLSWEWRRWRDADADRLVSQPEILEPLRRGGPEFTSVARDLPRPHTLGLSIGIEKRFRRGYLRFTGYRRWSKRLLQTVNVGIRPESYERIPLEDPGLDGIAGTRDDTLLTIFDQREQRGEDRFLLTHPRGLESYSEGLDLTLRFEHGWLAWSLSGRAFRDVGRGNVGNEVHLNDTGVLGDLFDDPNTSTNAEGRLFFDRAFTGKLRMMAKAPKEISIGAAVRYWDGQPFARHLFFPELGQGFTIVQALPRGLARYTFNMTVDVRIEKEVRLGDARLGLGMDVFNLLNQALETAEVVQGERFRDTTAVQPARTLSVDARIRF